MNSIKIDGYLTQKKLSDSLRSLVDPTDWIGTEMPVEGDRRKRWDILIKLSGTVCAVEYDGDLHYYDSLRIKSDREKERLASLSGTKAIRIPYWIQLTSQTLLHFFGIEANVLQDYPHGFIDTKIFPASFSYLGIEKFRKEMLSLPDNVRAEVHKTLDDRAKQYGREFVFGQY